MADLLLHPDTKAAVEGMIQTKPHAVMLTGDEGSGKLSVAIYLAEQLLSTNPDTSPYFRLISPEKNSIGIDRIRELQQFIKLKTTGSAQIRRVVIVQDAHCMTVESQNALLKTLEEPPTDTVLILTAQGDRSLKPTIYSRVQRVHVKPIARNQARQYAAENGFSQQFDKAFGLSGGSAGLYLALLQPKGDHQLLAAIDQAKQLLTSSTYEKLCRVDEISKQKDFLGDLMVALKLVSAAALRSSVSKGDDKLRVKWTKSLEAVYQAESSLAANGNTKLVLTDLFLNL